MPPKRSTGCITCWLCIATIRIPKRFIHSPDFISFVKDLTLDYLFIFFYITNFSEKMAVIVAGSEDGSGFFAVYRTVATYRCSPDYERRFLSRRVHFLAIV